MIARALLVSPSLLVPVAPPGDGPLEVTAVDSSGFPTVVVEVAAPVRFTAQPITAAMVEVDGAVVQSATPVDPSDVVIGLVIDDRPVVAPDVVTSLQGAAMELVRLTRDDIEVSLGTPSGLRTALTSDRVANISRIAGITAGSPAVVRPPDVITDTVAELASSSAADRHAVVVLGAPVDVTESQLTGLAQALRESGTVLHVVAPANVDQGALVRLARRTGGSASTSPQPLAPVDAVTATISNRYRVVTTMREAGPHRVSVTVDGERFSASFEVAESTARAAPSPSPAAPADEQERAPAATGTIADRAAAPAQPDVARSGDDGGLPVRTLVVIAAVLGAVVLAAGAVIAVLRRRGGGVDEEEPVVVKPPAAAVVPPTPPKPPVVASKPASKPIVGEPRRRASVTPLARRPPRGPASRPEPRSPTTPLRRAPARPAARARADELGWIVVGDLRMSRPLGEVWCGNRKVVLTAAELGVLELLLTSGGQGVTREEIIEAGQLDESDGPDAVDAIVATVRRKTGIRGRGRAVRKERVVMYFLEGADDDLRD